MENYSVLMSVYEKEKPEWLKQSIDSMLAQTYLTNDFVIIKDGPLTKDLDKVISEYQERYSDIFHVVALEKNVGLGPALAMGIQTCKNNLIARMDSDDIAVPHRCEMQLKKMKENSEIGIIGSSVGEFIDTIDNIQAYRILPRTNEQIQKFARKRNPFAHPSVMLRKEDVLKAGNYRDYYLCEDYDMWIRMIQKGVQCYNFKDILVYMRISQDFYRRRGGLKYLRSILAFKKEQYKNGFYTWTDYIISAGTHILICLLPNGMREIFYKKMLRRKVKHGSN